MDNLIKSVCGSGPLDLNFFVQRICARFADNLISIGQS
jgi:hypothetical protein